MLLWKAAVMRVQSMSRIKRLFSSVFVRLLLVCLFAWLLITVAVSVLFISHRFMAGVPYSPLVAHYLEYLVADLNGQQERAVLLANRLGIDIEYQGENSRWSSGGTPLPKSLHFFQAPRGKGMAFAFRRGVKYLRYQHPTGTYLFTVPDNYGEDQLQSGPHLFALVIIALVFAGAYLLIRRILAPISILHEATRKVGKGDLSHKVLVQGNSELARLADSFNDMVRQVREMITAKEQLLRDVSHELRSPLTRIKVLLEMVEPPDRVELIRGDVRELEDLVTSILETARHFHQLDGLSMEEVDLCDLVAEAIKRRGEEAAEVVLEVPEHPVMARIDRRLFARVTDNLLANALVHGLPAVGPVRVRIEQGTCGIEFSVVDSGPGIGEEDLPHVMEPFYQADKSRSRENNGYGLGLCLCKTIVEAHGGELILSSQRGRGTTALVRLAAGPGQPAEPLS
ncbi:MAG: HAMP domain-containing sensor histidine kinase [Desulfoprunum sp.]|nr:HAMP domain-containing sensor histidine kinase [Desulfoprunum sp.]